MGRRERSGAVIVVLAAALGPWLVGMDGCGGSGDTGGTSRYVGADVCISCHREVHTQWSATKHAAALESLEAAGSAGDAECLPCHTTGYGEGGFVSTILTPKFGGVQCESCHGPGSPHTGTRRPEDIIRAPGTTVCTACHRGPEQPNFEEWMESRHAMSLASVRDDPAATDECLACHSYDVMRAVRQNAVRALQGLPLVSVPSIEDDDASNDPVEPVGCAACHAPHGSANAPDLRAAGAALCAQCHQDAVVEIRRLPHAPQQNILLGMSGLQTSMAAGEATQPLVGLPSVHSTVDGGCATCHGPNVRVDAPSEATPNLSGHRFEVRFDLCLPCHDATSAESLTAARQSDTAAGVAALRARIEAIDDTLLERSMRDRLAAAALNLDLIEYDRSGGAHNAPYAEAMLSATDELVTQVEAAAP